MHNIKLSMRAPKATKSSRAQDTFFDSLRERFEELEKPCRELRRVVSDTSAAWRATLSAMEATALSSAFVDGLEPSSTATSLGSGLRTAAHEFVEVVSRGDAFVALQKEREAVDLLEAYVSRIDKLRRNTVDARAKALNEYAYYEEKLVQLERDIAKRKQKRKEDVEKLARNRQKKDDADRELSTITTTLQRGLDELERSRHAVQERVYAALAMAHAARMRSGEAFFALADDVRGEHEDLLVGQLHNLSLEELARNVPSRYAATAGSPAPPAPPAYSPSYAVPYTAVGHGASAPAAESHAPPPPQSAPMYGGGGGGADPYTSAASPPAYGSYSGGGHGVQAPPPPQHSPLPPQQPPMARVPEQNSYGGASPASYGSYGGGYGVQAPPPPPPAASAPPEQPVTTMPMGATSSSAAPPQTASQPQDSTPPLGLD